MTLSKEMSVYLKQHIYIVMYVHESERDTKLLPCQMVFKWRKCNPIVALSKSSSQQKNHKYCITTVQYLWTRITKNLRIPVKVRSVLLYCLMSRVHHNEDYEQECCIWKNSKEKTQIASKSSLLQMSCMVQQTLGTIFCKQNMKTECSKIYVCQQVIMFG